MKPLKTPQKKKKIPVKKKTPLKRKQYTKKQMEDAINAVKTGQSPFAAANAFNVPRATLISKIEEKYQSDTSGPDGYLNINEEKMLVDWVKAMGNAGFPITKNQLLDSVQKVVVEMKRKQPDRNFPFTDNRPGRHWFEGFMRRHPDISMRVAQNLTSSRASVTEEKIRAWHGQILEYLKENNLEVILKDPRRIFNADEAAFFLNPKGNKVLFTRGEKCVYSVVNVDEKECLTVMMTCNAAGVVAPPMVVFQYERIPQDIVDSINPLWGIGKSENGWMTSAVFYEFVTNIFHPWLLQEKIPLPVLLFVDGHISHLSLHTSHFCENNGIILVALYPNSTHIIQPMDVAIFRTLKGSWKEEVHEWRMKEENFGKEFKKRNFAPVLQKAVKKVVTEQVINNGFRKCGLYPWDADAINYKVTKCNAASKDKTGNSTSIKDVPTKVTNGRENKRAIALEVLESEIGPIKLELFQSYASNESWEENIDVRDHSLFVVWNKIQSEVDLEMEFDGLLPVINENDLAGWSTAMVEEIQVLAMEPLNESMELSEAREPPETVEPLEARELPETREPSEAREPIEAKELAETREPLEDRMEQDQNEPGCSSTTIATKIDNIPEDDPKIDEGERTNHTPLLPSPFKQLLIYPEVKDLKKKKRIKEVIPFVVSGKQYQEYYKKKEGKKKEQELLKAERMRKRKEKAEEKAKAQEMKNQKKTEKKIAKKTAYEDTSEEESSVDDESDKILLDKKCISVNSYVIVQYEGEYFPGIVLEKKKDGATVKVMGMAGVDTWKWPDKDDVLFYEYNDIKTVIDFPQLKNNRGHYFIPEILKCRRMKL